MTAKMLKRSRRPGDLSGIIQNMSLGQHGLRVAREEKQCRGIITWQYPILSSQKRFKVNPQFFSELPRTA